MTNTARASHKTTETASNEDYLPPYLKDFYALSRKERIKRAAAGLTHNRILLVIALWSAISMTVLVLLCGLAWLYFSGYEVFAICGLGLLMTGGPAVVWSFEEAWDFAYDRSLSQSEDD